MFDPGTLIDGRYRLEAKVGEGAMGVVFRACNETTQRRCAVKLLRPQAAGRPGATARFFAEARITRGLRHPSIVEVYDAAIHEVNDLRVPFLVMELLEGEPLDQVLQRLGKLPAGSALRIVRDVARGLQLAHGDGLIHRDLKPANIFLHRTPSGAVVPKLFDFGVAKRIGRAAESNATCEDDAAEITAQGTFVGSPAYMSPEHLLSPADLDARADVWALGVVLYRSISGELPFRSFGSLSRIASAICGDQPTPIDVYVAGISPSVAALVMRCLEKARERRFVGAGALADAIDAELDLGDAPSLELARVVHLATAARDTRASDRAQTRPMPLFHLEDAFAAAANESVEDPRDATARAHRRLDRPPVDDPADDTVRARRPLFEPAPSEHAPIAAASTAHHLASFAASPRVAATDEATRDAVPAAPRAEPGCAQLHPPALRPSQSHTPPSRARIAGWPFAAAGVLVLLGGLSLLLSRVAYAERGPTGGSAERALRGVASTGNAAAAVRQPDTQPASR
jgi:serine/threonine-protein kinase